MCEGSRKSQQRLWTGDFTRFITVEASREMDSLNMQHMVFNLRDSIQKNTATREAAELANRARVFVSHEIRYRPIVSLGSYVR